MNVMIKDRLAELKNICIKRNVRTLAFLDSAAKDSFDPASSDMDFVVEFSAMEPSAHADNYFGLIENLEELFGVEIDLVEASTIKNPYFREAVAESPFKLYDAA